jgi:hypothetical protein
MPGSGDVPTCSGSYGRSAADHLAEAVTTRPTSSRGGRGRRRRAGLGAAAVPPDRADLTDIVPPARDSRMADDLADSRLTNLSRPPFYGL